MKLSVIALSLLMLVGAGCNRVPTTPTAPDTNTNQNPSEDIAVSIDGDWELSSFTAAGESEDDVSEFGATLKIEDGARLSAKICNSMSGEYDIQAGRLMVETLASTKMFCEGQLGDIETAFSAGLSTGMTYDLRGDTLVLHSQFGADFTFERADGESVGTPTDGEPTEGDRDYAGVVTEVNLEQMMVDGPAEIVIRTSAGTSAKILVPSMGLPLCKAMASIANVSDIKVGQNVEARGSIGAEADSIVPCQSEAHYLRVVTK